MNDDHDPTRIDLAVDPRTQRLTGTAVHGNVDFDVPFISHIEGNLWQGGCQDGLVLPDDIVHVVSLYPWERYDLHPAVRSFTEIRAYDSGDPTTIGGLSDDEVLAIASRVVECTLDGPTLVHCQAGLNRSGLIAAAALVLGGAVHDGAEAVEVVRARRSPAVLCNRRFADWVITRFPSTRLSQSDAA